MVWESIIIFIANQLLRQEDAYVTQPPQIPRRTEHHDIGERGLKEEDRLEAGYKYDPVMRKSERRGGGPIFYSAKATKSGRLIVLTDKARAIN